MIEQPDDVPAHSVLTVGLSVSFVVAFVVVVLYAVGEEVAADAAEYGVELSTVQGAGVAFVLAVVVGAASVALLWTTGAVSIAAHRRWKR